MIPSVLRAVRRRWRHRHGEQGGYITIIVAAFVASGLFMASAAISVDTANWYREAERVQKAADAAALGGVPFLPHDLAKARQRALQVAARNGFDPTTDPDVRVTVSLGDRGSQLRVVIRQRATNHFAASFGVTGTWITRESVTDYQGPSPMGSPCATFGNEPNSGTGASSLQPSGSVLGASPFANCSRRPLFWATIEGPETGKIQGDRYQTRGCEVTGVDGCSGLTNEEYDEFGHVFLVKVQEAAVGTPIQIQLYDPMFANTGQFCDLLPSAGSFSTSSSLVNRFTSHADARNRYTRDGSDRSAYCTGDSYPGSISSSPTPVDTSFVLRQQVDSQDPHTAPVQNDVVGQPCIRQYRGISTDRSSGGFSSWDHRWLTSSAGSYIDNLAELFHNWTSLCTFTPTRAGDYYLQARTNVSFGGSATANQWVRTGNTDAAAATGNTTSGAGSNSFAIRAVTQSGLEKQVAVSGFEHMPIFINSDAATSTFNLVRVLPGSAGQQVTFSYFDAGDAQASGSVRVLPPTDATGSITTNPFPGGCRSTGGSAGSGSNLSSCNAPILQSSGGTSRNNGRTQTITIPIPADYTCDYDSLAGCWYRVQMSFGSGSVHDVTTWDARILGDPVRLVR